MGRKGHICQWWIKSGGGGVCKFEIVYFCPNEKWRHREQFDAKTSLSLAVVRYSAPSPPSCVLWPRGSNFLKMGQKILRTLWRETAPHEKISASHKNGIRPDKKNLSWSTSLIKKQLQFTGIIPSEQGSCGKGQVGAYCRSISLPPIKQRQKRQRGKSEKSRYIFKSAYKDDTSLLDMNMIVTEWVSLQKPRYRDTTNLKKRQHLTLLIKIENIKQDFKLNNNIT